MQAQAPPPVPQAPPPRPPALVPGGLDVKVPTTEIVQQYLEDNESLIRTILECVAAGRVEDAVMYQQRLQQNLMWLAGIADSQAPPTPATSAPAAGSAVPPVPGQPAAAATGHQAVQAGHTVSQEVAAQQAAARQATSQQSAVTQVPAQHVGASAPPQQQQQSQQQPPAAAQPLGVPGPGTYAG